MTPQVTAGGTRPGWSAASPLARESPRDSEAGSVGSEPALGLESPGDSDAGSVGSEPALGRESPGDSEASGDFDGLSDGLPDALPDALSEGEDVGEPDGDVEGVAEEDGVDPEPPLPPLPPLPPPGVGVTVGVVDGEVVGVELVLGDDVGVAGFTGGATPGAAAFPGPCFHDQPTDPPAGTISPPAPEEE
jgi:hypothetical protein